MEQYTTSSSSASSLGNGAALGNGNLIVSDGNMVNIQQAHQSILHQPTICNRVQSIQPQIDSPSCTSFNTVVINNSSCGNICKNVQQIKNAIVRKSSSNLSMGSKKSTVMLPSIGEVSNDEADSPKNAVSPRIVYGKG